MLQNANQRYRSCEIKSFAGVKEQLVRLKGKEQLKVKVARPLRRAWTPTKNITQWENNIRFSNIVNQCIPRERRGERYV